MLSAAFVQCTWCSSIGMFSQDSCNRSKTSTVYCVYLLIYYEQDTAHGPIGLDPAAGAQELTESRRESSVPSLGAEHAHRHRAAASAVQWSRRDH
jgi:hypothetical protein